MRWRTFAARRRSAGHREVPQWDLRPSIDDLQNAVVASNRETQSEKRLKSDPPQFIFSNDPAVLLLYDGKPLLRPLEKTSLQRAVNTPLFVACETEAGRCFIYGARFWYEAPDPIGPWKSVEAPSPAVKAFFDANPPPPPGSDATTEEQREAARVAAEQVKTPPRIVVATVPTELIVFEGPPNRTTCTATAPATCTGRTRPETGSEGRRKAGKERDPRRAQRPRPTADPTLATAARTEAHPLA